MSGAFGEGSAASRCCFELPWRLVSDVLFSAGAVFYLVALALPEPSRAQTQVKQCGAFGWVFSAIANIMVSVSTRSLPQQLRGGKGSDTPPPASSVAAPNNLVRRLSSTVDFLLLHSVQFLYGSLVALAGTFVQNNDEAVYRLGIASAVLYLGAGLALAAHHHACNLFLASFQARKMVPKLSEGDALSPTALSPTALARPRQLDFQAWGIAFFLSDSVMDVVVSSACTPDVRRPRVPVPTTPTARNGDVLVCYGPVVAGLVLWTVCGIFFLLDTLVVHDVVHGVAHGVAHGVGEEEETDGAAGGGAGAADNAAPHESLLGRT